MGPNAWKACHQASSECIPACVGTLLSYRYDVYRTSLSTPAVISLLTALQQPLLSLFNDTITCSSSHQQQHSIDHVQYQSQPLPAASAAIDVHHQRLGFSQFLDLLQSRGVIPQLLQPADVGEVLKRTNFSRRPQVGGLVEGLGFKMPG